MLTNCCLRETHGKCHLQTHTKKKALLTPTEKETTLLVLRTGLPRSTFNKVCNHHHYLILKWYSWRQKKCCDPMDSHPDSVRKKGIREITLGTYYQYRHIAPRLVPGDKICTSCSVELRKKIKETPKPPGPDELPDAPTAVIIPSSSESSAAESDKDDETWEPEEPTSKQPRKRGRPSKNGGENSIAEDDPLQGLSDEALRKKLKDFHLYEKMFEKLKEKFKSPDCSNAERIQILTLSPFGIHRTIAEFGTTHYLVLQSRKLCEEKGILGAPMKLHRRSVSAKAEALARIAAKAAEKQAKREQDLASGKKRRVRKPKPKVTPVVTLQLEQPSLEGAPPAENTVNEGMGEISDIVAAALDSLLPINHFEN